MTNLGTKVGAWLAGDEAPALTRLRFPLVPAPYEGRPWFMPFAGEWFRLQDRLAARTRDGDSALDTDDVVVETVPMSETTDLLAKVPLLSSLDEKQLERLCARFQRAHVPGRERRRSRGRHPWHGLLRRRGRRGHVTVGGKEVGKIGPGSYFGEVALISDRSGRRP